MEEWWRKNIFRPEWRKGIRVTQKRGGGREVKEKDTLAEE